MKTNVLRIRTPEGVVFSQSLAGPVVRFCAWVVDSTAIMTLMTLCGMFVTFFGLISSDFAGALYALLYFVISIGYGLALEWFLRGQTFGKKLFRLRVVDAEGLKLQFHQIAIRNLLRFIDTLPFVYLVGGVSCWITRKNQRLGDIAANTLVVRLPRVAEPDVEQLLAGRYNSLRQHPHLGARLRQHTEPAEASLALQALLRRDDFDPSARLELFADLARHFRAKVTFPAEATDGISDEQYVRNVVDILYRSRGQSHPRTQPVRTAA
ncbi:MAG: RDD family protein [Terrimicrobiaceae bacterium]